VFDPLKPTSDVSAARHRVDGFLRSDAAARGVRYVLAIDLLLLASVFVLGGNFWDKIRALFVREATVHLPTAA